LWRCPPGASVMLEQAMRAESVDVQMQCYAVCLNTLMLVEPNYAWIVKPTDDQEVFRHLGFPTSINVKMILTYKSVVLCQYQSF
jgi:hypothetical protein